MRLNRVVPAALAVALLRLLIVESAAAQVTLQLADFVQLPVTGAFVGSGNPASLARVNFLRPEPVAGGRLFVNDLNGPLYILDPRTKQLSTYLQFNGRGSRTGLFERFTYEAGFANGLITFQFDPDYARNGRFYTLHLEDSRVAAPLTPDASEHRGLAVGDYQPTSPVATPGPVVRHGVLVEWTDTQRTNTTFEGHARELLRVSLNTQIHPVGDLVFNPAARRGDPDWRVLYVGIGDGGSGEQKTTSGMRANPQRLDTLVGKVLRIVPDLTERTGSSTISENGRYRVPADNPFTTVAGARPEIWAYGLRNPHRLVFETDPLRARSSHLLATSIGLHTWESVLLIQKGVNYGYPLREGVELLNDDNTTGPLPDDDRIPLQVTDGGPQGMVSPVYPVLAYTHKEGFAIAGGFVYRGSRIPLLRGKFVFGDIASGQLWYADYKEMLAAHDGKADTLASKHPIRLRWDDPHDVPDTGTSIYDSMAPIVSSGYQARLRASGAAARSTPSRADIRLAVDARGELYILSKVDGMVRAIVGAK